MEKKVEQADEFESGIQLWEGVESCYGTLLHGTTTTTNIKHCPTSNNNDSHNNNYEEWGILSLAFF